MAIKVAEEWLNACSGCEISVVDMGERLLEILEHCEFVHMPVIMDHKYYGQLGTEEHLEIPEAHAGIITGGIRNEEHLEVAREMRKKCDRLIALGTCATHGGIPALANSYSTEDVLARYYSTETTDRPKTYPDQGVPAQLERCYALDEQIRVDLALPGCPPHPDTVYAALLGLARGEIPELPTKSVCDVCPAKREGKGGVGKLRRFLQSPVYESDKPLDEMRCFLEQGILCMGPVTREGCGGDNRTPRCISGRVPCRGCFGPVKPEGNQLLDMLNALASNNADLASLPEHISLLRFSGAHGRLQIQHSSEEEICRK
jgi:F420-non-reducing hydrogenase small subunit